MLSELDSSTILPLIIFEKCDQGTPQSVNYYFSMTPQGFYWALASTDLKIHRGDRYDGGGFRLSLDALVPEDVSLVLRLYRALKRVYDLWLYMGETSDYQLLQTQLMQFYTPEFLRTAQAIGTATYALDDPPQELRKACHDLRGGALTALTSFSRLLSRRPGDQHLVRKAVFLARDHAKMMRSILPDLDEAIHAADERVKRHSIHEFVDKWHEITVEMVSKRIRVVALCDFECYITSRCLESSAVDRILYNYINNGVRFSDGEIVRLTVIRLNSVLTRWVVENQLTNRQKVWLHQTLGDELAGLFQGGYTRSGEGIGLSNCSDLVAASFGLSPSEAIERGYLGARVFEDTYYAWFHWPIYLSEDENEQTASKAASFTRLAKSAPAKPGVRVAICCKSTSLANLTLPA